jgi:hypothetical protein
MGVVHDVPVVVIINEVVSSNRAVKNDSSDDQYHPECKVWK